MQFAGNIVGGSGSLALLEIVEELKQKITPTPFAENLNLKANTALEFVSDKAPNNIIYFLDYTGAPGLPEQALQTLPEEYTYLQTCLWTINIARQAEHGLLVPMLV